MSENSISELGSGSSIEHSQGSEGPQRRAAIYARTSSPSQEFGYSLDEQVRQCVKRCRALDWIIGFVYRDNAESGKDTDRPMFQEMLTQARRGSIDVVVFWKLDRFSRTIMHAVQLERQFRDWGVALHSITEQIDTTTAAGQFNFRNLANTAEFEREMIRSRTKMGHAARATEGKWPNGKPPLGYDLAHDGRLRIIESEASIVRSIFRRYIETQSMAQVANELNNRRETNRGNKNKQWTPAAVSEILRNQLYIGTYVVGEVTRTEPEYQIVAKDSFEEAQDVRTRFQSSGTQSREKMSDKRKVKRTKRILDQYRDWNG